MITPYKERTIDLEKPVTVYRNLHKKCYSIKQSGKVVAHGTNFVLDRCIFKINKSEQKRVRDTGHKNVHAIVQGRIYNSNIIPEFRAKITYNPYTHDGFMSDGKIIEKAILAGFGEDGLSGII